MQVTINIDHSALDECGISPDQFQEAARNALSNLINPETGETIYFNDVQVMVIADCPEIVVG